MARPHLIGIAGGSCCGKTSIATELARALGAARTLSIALDSYYHDLSHLDTSVVAEHNLDEPAALEHRLVIDHIERLARGERIDKPVYDHKTHARAPDPESIVPSDYVIIEGLFALYWIEVRGHLSTMVFIDTTHDVCLERRIARDRNQRGRTPEEVRYRYQTMVAPMYDQHVLPTRQHADTLVDGHVPVATSVEIIVQKILGSAGK